MKGTLLQKIKEEYEKVPPSNRGEYYSWLLANQYVLDPSSGHPGDNTDEWKDAPRGYPPGNSSVFDLMEYVAVEDARIDEALILSVGADYGFFNCKTREEKLKLKKMYKSLFDNPRTDLYQLHDACIQGKLYEYINTRARLEPQDFFRRVLKNMYPLPEY